MKKKILIVVLIIINILVMSFGMLMIFGKTLPFYNKTLGLVFIILSSLLISCITMLIFMKR